VRQSVATRVALTKSLTNGPALLTAEDGGKAPRSRIPGRTAPPKRLSVSFREPHSRTVEAYHTGNKSNCLLVVLSVDPDPRRRRCRPSMDYSIDGLSCWRQ
jgi:hypothetical protein